jgi:nicotinate-nucleotide pyrophosphorylase (carboxylating)
MISKEQFQRELELIIKNGIREDIGPGDYSSLACIPADAKGKAKLLVKDEGIIAGVAFAKMIFAEVDANVVVETFINDGEKVKYGDVVFHVSGSSQSILRAERLVLNSMQRMSAIATKTNHFVQLLEGTKTKILDTRKTTPGFRACEKWAVKIGGGENHRFALYDMIMLKDNHNDFAGGITHAINKTKAFLAENNLDLKIIVEARNLDEIKEILENEGVYRILIDNFKEQIFSPGSEILKLLINTCKNSSFYGDQGQKFYVDHIHDFFDDITKVREIGGFGNAEDRKTGIDVWTNHKDGSSLSHQIKGTCNFIQSEDGFLVKAALSPNSRCDLYVFSCVVNKRILILRNIKKELVWDDQGVFFPMKLKYDEKLYN